MPATYESIATTTLGSASSTITFNSIPSTYTDLRLVFTASVTSAAVFNMRYNGDSGNNYAMTSIYGNGSSIGSESPTNLSSIRNSVNISTTQPNLHIFDIMSYTGTTNKTTLFEFSGDNNGSSWILREVALWNSSSTISSIELSIGSSFVAGATATLYGILRA